MHTIRMFGLLMAFTLASTSLHAQETPVVRADIEASKTSQDRARIDNLPDQDVSKLNIQPVDTKPNIFLRDETEVVATWDGGQLTNKDVMTILETRQPSNVRVSSPEQFTTLNRNIQTEAVKQIAYERILLDKAREAGYTEDSPAIAAKLKSHEAAALNRAYYTEKVNPRLDQLTKETARDYYEENKDTEFTAPPLTVIRVAHINTYEMVTAEEGDTLESLAVAITGNKAAAKDIREARPPYFGRDVPQDLEDKVLTTPLKPGEVLYVPMGKDAITTATELAGSIRQLLIDGQTLDQAVASVQSSDLTVSITQPLRFSEDAGYWDEIVTAVKNREHTSVTDVIRTPAGVDVVFVEDDRTSRAVPYEQVQETITSKILSDETERRQTIEVTRKDILNDLWQKYNVQVNEDIIQRPTYLGTDPLTSDTVILTVDDLEYTLDDYLTDLRRTGKGWAQLTAEERMEVLRVAPVVTDYLIAKDARALGLHETEEFKTLMQAFTEAEIVSAYRAATDDPASRRISDQQLRAYYTDNLDDYTSPAQVTIRELSKRINMTLPPAAKAKEIEEAQESLREIRSRINSVDDFAQLARRESHAISTRSRGGLIGTVPENFRGEPFKNQLRQLEIGDVSEPFIYGSEVMIVRLDNRIAPTALPFEQVRRRVMQDYARSVPQQDAASERDQALEAVNFKITF